MFTDRYERTGWPCRTLKGPGLDDLGGWREGDIFPLHTAAEKDIVGVRFRLRLETT
jgi:hypothetical protein